MICTVSKILQEQGLLSFLFNCVSDQLVRYGRNTRDVTVTLGRNPNNITIDCLAFADDWTLNTDSLDNVIKQQLQELQEQANRFSLQI